MHPYERYILQVLTKEGEARYRDLKPAGAESNLFIYHLKQLIKKAFIEKVAKGYALTPAGKRYVDTLSLATVEPRKQPKIVTVIICTNQKGEHLVFTRKREPFRGMKGFPYGKIHLGEELLSAAKRELAEKCGLTASLERKGEYYLTISKKGEMLTSMFCHVFVAKNPKGKLRDSDYGESVWKDIRDLHAADFIPGFLEMSSLAKKKGTFFAERNLETD